MEPRGDGIEGERWTQVEQEKVVVGNGDNCIQTLIKPL